MADDKITSTSPVSDKQLDLEFSWTPVSDCCQNQRDIVMFCRRPFGHEGEHAAGWHASRTRWAE